MDFVFSPKGNASDRTRIASPLHKQKPVRLLNSNACDVRCVLVCTLYLRGNYPHSMLITNFDTN